MEGNKKRICLVQATTTHKSEIPIPYSVGVLQAYAQRNAIVNNEYYFEPIIVEKTDINQAAKELSNADIVAFSSYIWNIEYNKAVAKKVKELSPKTVVIFGGHSIPCDIVPFMKTEYYVDFAIVGEGELSFEPISVTHPVLEESLRKKLRISAKNRASEKKASKKTDGYRKKYEITLFISVILAVSVIGMFIVASTSDSPTIINYENKLIDKYAAWEQELDEREAALKEREQTVEEP